VDREVVFSMREIALTYPSLALLIGYLLVVGVLCVYGLHRYWLVALYLRRRNRVGPRAERLSQVPRVTVQLPMFNESAVAERVIEAAATMDYPPELLEVQVLDDSTNECREIARACCERLRGTGKNVKYIHRENRSGYKAGALEAGLHVAEGEFLAIFDADFVPPRELLLKMVHEFADERVGMVQARWTHLNRGDSLLTEAQAMFLDGHFVVEQTARAAGGRWFNFNGTAGLWRKSCIVDSGGWQHDTLTEDTDLSYRAQLQGWTCVYLPQVECPAELPPTVSAFMGQQHRWNKGLTQTAIKLLPTILRSKASLGRKIEAWFHLTSPCVHLLMLVLVLIVLAVAMTPMEVPSTGALPLMLVGFGFLALGTVAASTFYVASQSVQGLSIVRTLLMLPALMAIGIGVTVVNSRAVIEAICGRHSPFIRTPKFNGGRRADLDPAARRRGWKVPSGVVELVLGALLLGALAMSLNQPVVLIGAPFLAMFAIGYVVIGVGALRGARR
jgi:cellulose synthase/poly-beta-1,6-N-acetylglucosamine synthase-like glycosyltransferase